MPWQEKIDFGKIDAANSTHCEWVTVYPEGDRVEFELLDSFTSAQSSALDISDPGDEYGEVYRNVHGKWQLWYQAAPESRTGARHES